MEKNLSRGPRAKFDIRFNLKTKIWITVLSVVLMFSFFILFYFPSMEEAYVLKDYNKEIQNSANTVSLGVKIALTEQNFEGVQTAIDFVKKDPHLEFVSLIQIDTTWGKFHQHFTLKRRIFKTFPEKAKITIDAQSNALRIVKRSDFMTPMMSGQIMLSMNTEEITKNKKQILTTSLVVSCIVFIIGLAMGFLLAKNISDPVLKLRDAAIRVSEGDLTQRVDNTSKDEIGELSIAFNKMVNDLGIARKEITSQRDQLKEKISELKNAQQQLIQSEKMASLGELTAGIAHEIQNPLNFVNNFSEVNTELLEELKEEINNGNVKDAMEIADNIRENELKIKLHGRRADGIVKSMLEHSRSTGGTREFTDINLLTEEYLRLSYHGLRAKDKSFTAVLQTVLTPDLPKINMIPQDLGRVLLNLFNNAFYATLQKQKLSHETYIPEVSVRTSFKNNQIMITVKDNGVGIPLNIREKIMQPFFTTKPTGEGTGLGLSLSYDIIVKSYGGTISLESTLGVGTEFFVLLPLG
jgi:two-component system NtrC family sensor kinase